MTMKSNQSFIPSGQSSSAPYGRTMKENDRLNCSLHLLGFIKYSTVQYRICVPNKTLNSNQAGDVRKEKYLALA